MDETQLAQEQAHLDHILAVTQAKLDALGCDLEESRQRVLEQKRTLWQDLYELDAVEVRLAKGEINTTLDDAQDAQAKIDRLSRVLATPYFGRIDFSERGTEDVFYIGRGLDYSVSLEGALKLKEISYIHAEAYAAGELKHGTLALITEGIPVIALATQKSVYEKTLSNIKEVKARDAVVIGIASEGDEELEKYVDHVMKVPATDELLSPILSVVPLQLLAYYAAITRGTDVDKPRNLAKSVTVE